MKYQVHEFLRLSSLIRLYDVFSSGRSNVKTTFPEIGQLSAILTIEEPWVEIKVGIGPVSALSSSWISIQLISIRPFEFLR